MRTVRAIPVSRIVAGRHVASTIRLWSRRGGVAPGGWQPCCDVAETDEAIIVEVELPGVERKDVRVEVDGDVLRITGERRGTVERQGRQYSQVELSYGRFARQLRLPATVDRAGIQARFRADILTITFPKKPPVRGAQAPGEASL